MSEALICGWRKHQAPVLTGAWCIDGFFDKIRLCQARKLKKKF